MNRAAIRAVMLPRYYYAEKEIARCLRMFLDAQARLAAPPIDMFPEEVAMFESDPDQVRLCFKLSKQSNFQNLDAVRFLSTVLATNYRPITYYWTVPLILDHSYLVGKLTSLKIADTKVSMF
jgi:hypothetical protein